MSRDNNLPRFTQRYFRVPSIYSTDCKANQTPLTIDDEIAKLLNPSCIYCKLSNLVKNTIYPRSPRPLDTLRYPQFVIIHSLEQMELGH